MSDQDAEETKQIPVDAPPAEETETPPPPDASERVDIVAPEPEPSPEPEPEPAPAWTPPPAAEAATNDDFVSQHPEALVAGAFAGAFVLAKLLQRIGGGS